MQQDEDQSRANETTQQGNRRERIVAFRIAAKPPRRPINGKEGQPYAKEIGQRPGRQADGADIEVRKHQEIIDKMFMQPFQALLGIGFIGRLHGIFKPHDAAWKDPVGSQIQPMGHRRRREQGTSPTQQDRNDGRLHGIDTA